MKNLLTFILLCFTITSFSQEKMKWFNGSIEEAMKKAETLDAILFFYIYPENNALTKKVNDY